MIAVEVAAMRLLTGAWVVSAIIFVRVNIIACCCGRHMELLIAAAGGMPLFGSGRGRNGLGAVVFLSRQGQFILKDAVKKTEVPHVVCHNRWLLLCSYIRGVQLAERCLLHLTKTVALELSLELATVHQKLAVLSDSLHHHVHRLPVTGARNGGWQTHHQNTPSVNKPLPLPVLRLGQQSADIFGAEAGSYESEFVSILNEESG